MILLLKNLLFTVVVPGTVAVYVPLRITQDQHSFTVPALVAGVLLLLMGGTTYAWCIWNFAAFGRGTPAPIDAPKKLVIRGLYRYVRNPMYVGVLLVILGWALMFKSKPLFAYAVVVGLCFHLVVVLYEEHHLSREFGDRYEQYRSEVGRWFPRLR
jgi:protein-S-isoprenylcysteine O-methyltransferase Ste14